MSDKRLEIGAVAGLIEDGMTIGIGGWGSRRKPMSLVRAIVRSRARGLTVVSFGGPDVGILCATGQARRVVQGFVSLDTIAIDPHFAARRQAGTVENIELDEAMLVSGLRAAGRRLPFEVTRAGAGSDAVELNPFIRTIVSPYEDAERLVAMPSIPLDLAMLHLHRADSRGAAVSLAPDPHFDDLFAMAASRTIVSVEQIVKTSELASNAHPSALLLNRTMVDYVVHAPAGAHFTAFPPDDARDEALQREYARSAASAEAWGTFHDRFIDVDESAYHRAVAEFAAEQATT